MPASKLPGLNWESYISSSKDFCIRIYTREDSIAWFTIENNTGRVTIKIIHNYVYRDVLALDFGNTLYKATKTVQTSPGKYFKYKRNDMLHIGSKDAYSYII